MYYTEEITDYIYKQMSPLKREAFELRLERDPELAAEVRQQQEMLEAVRAARMYQEAMNDPHLEEADKLAKEIIQERSKKISGTKRRTKIIHIARILTSSAAVLVLFFMSIKMNHKLLSIRRRAQMKTIRSSWKMLWIK